MGEWADDEREREQDAKDAKILHEAKRCVYSDCAYCWEEEDAIKEKSGNG